MSWRVSAAGGGTLQGFTLPAEGTLDVSDLPSGASQLRLPVTCVDVSGLDNVAGWSIVQIGVNMMIAPAVAVLSDRTTRNDSGMWQMVGPMPIAWGTRDRKVIALHELGIDPGDVLILLAAVIHHEEDPAVQGVMPPEDVFYR